MDRFLSYSLRHQRAICLVILQADGSLKRLNATVLDMTDDSLSLQFRKGGKAETVPRANVLACAYKRGDQGSLEDPVAD